MSFQDDIQTAIEAHAMWKINLLKAIDSGAASTLDPAKVCLDNQCPFGCWLYGATLPEKAKALEQFAECVELHKQFHLSTGEILRLAMAGKRREALDALCEPSPYYELSATLVQLMKAWAAAYEKANSGQGA